MASVVDLNAFWKQTFAPALTPAGQSRAAALCLHARTESVLTFTRAFRWLISPFHTANLRAAKLGWRAPLSIASCSPIADSSRL
jgi:hypothetical protein